MELEVKMSLQEKLVYLRKQRGLTQLDLAEMLNVSRQAVSRWEVGSAVPSVDNLRVLSHLYDVSLDYLVKDSSKNLHEVVENKNCLLTGQETKKQGSKRYLFLAYTIILGFLFVICVTILLRQGLQAQDQIVPIKEMDSITQDNYPVGTFYIE